MKNTEDPVLDNNDPDPLRPQYNALYGFNIDVRSAGPTLLTSRRALRTMRSVMSKASAVQRRVLSRLLRLSVMPYRWPTRARSSSTNRLRFSTARARHTTRSLAASFDDGSRAARRDGWHRRSLLLLVIASGGFGCAARRALSFALRSVLLRAVWLSLNLSAKSISPPPRSEARS